jgi:hypothetical protein
MIVVTACVCCWISKARSVYGTTPGFQIDPSVIERNPGKLPKVLGPASKPSVNSIDVDDSLDH